MFLNYNDCYTVVAQILFYQDHKQLVKFRIIMSIKPTYSLPSYSSCPSNESQDMKAMKSMPSSGSPPSQNLLQPNDIGRKLTTSSSASRNSDNSGRAFLSVRKNVGLLKSHSNFTERHTVSGQFFTFSYAIILSAMNLNLIPFISLYGIFLN